MKMERSERDYPQGWYLSSCQKCGRWFIGPRHERICALCVKEGKNGKAAEA